MVFKYFLSKEAKEKGINFKAPRELDAGFDLPALEDISISAGGFQLIRTGIHFSIPKNWVGLIRDRSSIALKGGCVTAGVIDASYRGEVKIAMHNLSDNILTFPSGTRIAQCVIVPHYSGEAAFEVQSIEELGDSERGSGGFGSTGIK